MSYPPNRRSARTVVADYVTSGCNKILLSACPPAIEHDLKVQLRTFRQLTIAMKWDDLTKKIDKALEPPPRSPAPPDPALNIVWPP